MKPFVKDRHVFVMNDEATCLEDGVAVGGTLHEFCAAAVLAMEAARITRHISYIGPGDLNECLGLKEGGRIPRVTIEWVAAAEAEGVFRDTLGQLEQLGNN